MRRPFNLQAALVAVFLLGAAAGSHAAVLQNATVSNSNISFENGGAASTTTVTYVLVGSGTANVEIDIFKLKNVSDTPSAENQVAGIVQPNVSTGTFTVPWNALWLISDDIGRQDGNYQVIITADAGTSGGKTNFVIP